MSEEGVIEFPGGWPASARESEADDCMQSRLERRDRGSEDSAPIGLGLGQVARNVLRPFRLNAVEVEVELAVDDLPVARIAVELLAERHAISAEAAIGRRVSAGVGFERVEMRLFHEAVGAAGMRHGIFVRANLGLCVG